MTGPTVDCPLDDLAQKYGTDKSTSGHGFTTIYETLLREWRKRSVAVLEIGVYQGASLRMWQDYFPQGRITGIEANAAAADEAGGRIKVHIGDQADPVFLEEVAHAEGPFDLVVDDGGHRATQQKVSLQSLWPHVKRGGIYIIEDIHTSYYETYDMGWRKPGTTVEFLKYVVDDIHESIHNQAVTLPGLESIQFYPELCIMRRSAER